MSKYTSIAAAVRLPPPSLLPPWLGWEEMAASSSSHFLALTAILTVAFQMIFFLVSALFRFDKLTDFAGTTNFLLLAIITLYLKGACHFRQVVLTALVLVWSLRLGLFLLMRILQWGEDRRLDKMRNSLSKLAVFWIFQAAWVWTVSLPVTIVNASDRNPQIKAQDIIGWTIWFLGFCIEAAADQQKLSFKSCPSNKGKWCNLGLWRYSRHPNYFGEMLLWWGIFLASTPVLSGAEWLVISGPIFLSWLLLFVSGIPLLEKSADKQFGGIEEYCLYKKTTSPLVPLKPTVYGRLPGWIKLGLLFELPLYDQKQIQQRRHVH